MKKNRVIKAMVQLVAQAQELALSTWYSQHFAARLGQRNDYCGHFGA
jgi:hypothetical protein